jgi:DUF971 family protein
VPEEDLPLTGASPIGQYALQLLFSDDHDRGIYPWDLPRGLAGEPAGATP